MKTHTSSLTILEIKKIIKSYLVTLRQENVLEKKKQLTNTQQLVRFIHLALLLKEKKSV